MSDTTRAKENIEHQLERDRAHIDRTVDALQHRLSPDTLIDQATTYMRGPGGRLVMDAVRRNPLAAALGIIGIGWLLLSIREADDRRRYRSEPREPAGGRYPPPAPRTGDTLPTAPLPGSEPTRPATDSPLFAETRTSPASPATGGTTVSGSPTSGTTY